MLKRGAIILAGGQAERFQIQGNRWTDKALAKISGKPLLIHIIEKVETLVEETIICVNNTARKRRYLKVLEDYSVKKEQVKILIDLSYPSVSGPSVAITTGLKAANADHCIVLPCDTPFIEPRIVEFLFNAVKNAAIAVPIYPDGSLETLMFTCKRLQTLQVTDTLCRLERDRPDDIFRASSKVKFISTVSELKDIDPEFKSFININLRRDLTDPQTRVALNGPVGKSVYMNLGSPGRFELDLLNEAARNFLNGKHLDAANLFSSASNIIERKRMNFWTGLCREKEGTALRSLLSSKDVYCKNNWHVKSEKAFAKAAESYAREAEAFEKNNIYLLAKRAKDDAFWCRSRIDAHDTLSYHQHNAA